MQTIVLLILGVLALTPQWAAGKSTITTNADGEALSAATLMPGKYRSALAAVIDASKRYNPISVAEDREYIGAIIERNGSYSYAVGKGEQGQDSVSVRFRVPRGATIIAFWHTHGAHGAGRSYFSAVDTQLANRMNKPFYLADPQGTLRVYRPGDPTLAAIRAEKLGLNRRSGFARGHRVARLNEEGLQEKQIEHSALLAGQGYC